MFIEVYKRKVYKKFTSKIRVLIQYAVDPQRRNNLKDAYIK